MDPSGGANSSSDFVRKLYKMLEDPSYESVVRWGNDGESFVVLENEKFTKSILPKHFKHSNFASFVRQLNKYDFHKVRHNNEDGTATSQYGAGAWEFKHPDFQMNNKDALDNIRRKAPVPRKPNAPLEDVMPTQQIDLVNTQIGATQQQLQSLQDRYNELSMHHQLLLQEVIGLQKTVVNHEHVIQNVMSFLHSVDSQRRRESRVVNPFAQAASTAPNGTDRLPPDDEFDDAPASPLQQADKLLNDLSADAVLSSRNLEQMTEVAHKMNGLITTPPASEAAFRQPRSSSRGPPPSASSSGTLRYGDIDHMVYPVGHSSGGIDPAFGGHISNIPYPLPAGAKPLVDGADGRNDRKKSNYDPGWVRQPQILLVEDDPTCRRIGGKFLYAFNCAIDNALDGLEAVNKMNAGSKYDLVLMDIIMPNLDGVSACHLIRQFDNTPIIAMTSNIRSDDISMYFQHGMNDVLPKPFTKEGLLTCLEKHLSHLKRANLAGSVKDDSPEPSPATLSSTNWNSPAQMQGPGAPGAGGAGATAGPSPGGSHISADDYLGAVVGGGGRPGPYLGMDPAAAYGHGGHAGHAGHGHSSAPHTPLGGPPALGAALPHGQHAHAQLPHGQHRLGPQAAGHRRHVSDMAGGATPGPASTSSHGSAAADDYSAHHSAAKRHQMYPPHAQHAPHAQAPPQFLQHPHMPMQHPQGMGPGR